MEYRWPIRATIAVKEKMMVDAAGTSKGQLNPLETMRWLKAADLTEAIAGELFVLSTAVRTRPATKADLVRLEGRLDSMVGTIRAERHADLDAAVVKMMAVQIATAVTLFAAVAVLIAAIRFPG